MKADVQAKTNGFARVALHDRLDAQTVADFRSEFEKGSGASALEKETHRKLRAEQGRRRTSDEISAGCRTLGKKMASSAARRLSFTVSSSLEVVASVRTLRSAPFLSSVGILPANEEPAGQCRKHFINNERKLNEHFSNPRKHNNSSRSKERDNCNGSAGGQKRHPPTKAVAKAKQRLLRTRRDFAGRGVGSGETGARLLVGHPFNPPHIIPLVEVVGGARTSPEAIKQAMAFYTSIGKKAIHVRKELPGHVANRLQAALYREMLYLIEQGVLSVEETDAAVCYGPGLRWGVMGQSLQWHVGGGAGGIKHFMEHLMDPLTGMMKALGNPQITPELKQTIIEGVTREAANRSVDELAQEENKLLVGYLALRAKAGNGQCATATA